MKKLHKLAAIVLVLATIVTAFAFPASAAYSTRVATYIEGCLPLVTNAAPLSGASKVYAYTNSSLTEKTSSSYIDTYTDKVVITDISISGKAVKATYPTSSGKYKSKWFATDDILGIEAVDIREYTAQHKLSVYRMSSSSDVKFTGYISVDDNCINLGRHSVGDTNYYVTIYPISEAEVNGITVRHKIALSPIAGYHRLSSKPCEIIDPAANKSAPSTRSAREDEVAATLEAMMNGTSHDGAYEVNTKYEGPYSHEQCKGFAKSVFQELFGYNIGSTQSRSSGENYKLNHSSSKTVYVGSVADISNDSTAELEKLFIDARPGDFVQMRRDHGGSHSAIVVSVSSSKLTLVEANVDGNNGIIKKAYTWSELCDSNEAMSLYTAKNY
ncbi:MAG: hypothetical protein IKL97_08210 [Eggerthellaceae bacterium]|nr:hypothetical protein [Eggerthellaceae bacterium]